MTQRAESDILAALDKAVANAFEQMAFQEVRREPEPLAAEEVHPLGWMEIRLLKPFHARLLLGCPEAMIREIAETAFCGAELPDGVDVCADTLAELTNTIAGTFLSHLEPEDASIQVDLPERVAPPPGGHAAGAGDAPSAVQAVYMLDDGTRFAIHIIPS